MKGVLDRIEDNLAVILIESATKEIIVDLNMLPAGSVAGTWFDIELDEQDILLKCTIDEKLTERKRESATDLLQQLQKRKKQSKFKRRKD